MMLSLQPIHSAMRLLLQLSCKTAWPHSNLSHSLKAPCITWSSVYPLLHIIRILYCCSSHSSRLVFA